MKSTTKERRKALSATLVTFTVALLLTMSMSVAYAPPPTPDLEIWVVYLSPYYYTPEGLPGYYIGSPFSCEVHIRNTQHRTYKHLNVTAIHEYYEDGFCRRWWWPYPLDVYFYKGEPLPGDSAMVWSDVEIRGNSEFVLTFVYSSPLACCSGLDQTHVILRYEKAHRGAVFYSEPECGVFCLM